MNILEETALSFNDVLLEPQFNPIDSRKNVDTTAYLGNNSLDIPIIAANMATVCEYDMSLTMGLLGGMGVVHRFMPVSDQSTIIRKLSNEFAEFGSSAIPAAALGIHDYERALACEAAGAHVFCVDVAHAHTPRVYETVENLVDRLQSGSTIIIGNVATADSARYFSSLAERFADHRFVLKVGIGGGSVCSTRIATGSGIPTLQSVMDVARVVRNPDIPYISIIADGGIRNSGDIVKALAAGADAVMLGSLLSGTDETPGEVFSGDKGKFKMYAGSASEAGKRTAGLDASFIEGVSTFVPYKGPVRSVVERLMDGVRSGMTYTGASNLAELRFNAMFRRITPAGMAESKPHIL